jgi:SAM-dependent methyltransferase
MAHFAQRRFLQWVRKIRPQYFNSGRVLDVGSLDVNGTNWPLFYKTKEYIGLDLTEGPNVHVVCKAHEYDEPDGSFDTIISGECFEHDEWIEQTLKNIVRLLKPHGLFVFTCANSKRPEHGTSAICPTASPATNEYYRGLDESDFREMLDFEDIFEEMLFRDQGEDLYFYGIKKGVSYL